MQPDPPFCSGAAAAAPHGEGHSACHSARLTACAAQRLACTPRFSLSPAPRPSFFFPLPPALAEGPVRRHLCTVRFSFSRTRRSELLHLISLNPLWLRPGRHSGFIRRHPVAEGHLRCSHVGPGLRDCEGAGWWVAAWAPCSRSSTWSVFTGHSGKLSKPQGPEPVVSLWVTGRAQHGAWRTLVVHRCPAASLLNGSAGVDRARETVFSSFGHSGILTDKADFLLVVLAVKCWWPERE